MSNPLSISLDTILSTEAQPWSVRRKRLAPLVLVLILPAIGEPAAQWLATAPSGMPLLLEWTLLFLMMMLGAFVALPAALIYLCLREHRRKAALAAITCLLFLASCFFGLTWGKQIRMAGMAACAERSKALVDAIKRFERDHAAPPHALADLVPAYLDVVPDTGMKGYPEYNYFVGNEAKGRFVDNPWALSINTYVFMNFDSLIYLPRQNYPESGCGGWLEPVGDWAYVHE
jgi:hypothetical protein